MRLKRIVLKGFKSFAERTEIRFPDGITAIVGPNGCGKSNIVDAFRWVMGEQSPRAMRGDKMHDVIFAGTPSRKAAECAEVFITFDQVQEALPVAADEVEVGRRLFPSGESEYFLNGSLSRQRDIHSLFWDSGLGKESFAIFEQGKVDEIIFLAPEERRQLFDSVAGIKRFRERRKESTRKLEQMEGNLTRLKDLLHEEKRRLSGLEKQVAEATRFKEQQSRLLQLETGLLYTKWRVEETQRQEASKCLAEADAAIREVGQQLAASEQARLKSRGNLSALDQQSRKATEELYKNRSQAEVRKAEVDSLKRREEELLRQEERLGAQILQLSRSDEEGKASVVAAENQLAGLEAREVETEKRLRSAKELAEGVQAEVEALRERQRAAALQKDALMGGSLSARTSAKESRLHFDAGARRLAELKSSQEQFLMRLETATAVSKEKRQAIEELTLQIDRRKQQVALLAQLIEEKRQATKAARLELEQLAMTLADARARQQILFRFQGEGLSSGAKRLLDEVKDKAHPLHGQLLPLHDLITPPEGQERAIASLLSAYGQTLVVPSEQALELAFALARELGLTDFSLATQATIQSLIANMQLTSVNFLAPGAVTQEGYYLDGNGVVFLPVRGEKSTLLRKSELSQLAKTLKKGEGRAAELEALLAELVSHEQKLRSEQQSLERAGRQDEMKLVEVNFILQQSLSQATEVKARLEQVSTQIEELTALQAKLESETAKAALEFERAEQELQEQQTAFAASEAALQEAVHRLRRSTESVREREEEHREVLRLRQEGVRRVEVIRVRLQEREGQIRRLQDEQKSIIEKRIELSSSHHKQISDASVLTDTILKTELKIGTIEEERKKASLALEVLEAEVREQQVKVAELRQEAQRLELLLAKVAATASALEKELTERFGVTVAEASHTTLDIPLAQAEQEIRNLRNDLGKADTVNLGAAVEYESQSKEFTALSAQVEDLRESKKELTKLIQQLDRTSRKRFKQTFETVRENFKSQFQVLFNGGDADLSLTGSEDLLEAGIEIIARPPGKQMRSISLLSGGEKCLTSMALLFAIFQVKPTPFCILDEIDAPLDDANVDRFLALLGPFMLKTQFLIVTHNKKTMSAADRLIGVSMEEKGVSKLLSVSFAREEALING